MKRRIPRRFRDAVGRSEYLRLHTAIWAPWLVFLLSLGTVAAGSRLTEYIAYYTRAFVDLLQVTKVLKMPLLENHELYLYASWALYGYVALAFLYDIAGWLWRGSGHDLLLTEEAVFLIQRRFPGYEISRWKKSDPVRVHLQTGRLRRLLGLERLVFHFPDKAVSSSWFSSWRGDNALIVSRIL
ncbi:MAG: hypothetical protein HY042_06550 [Spirochaetia bacterium]|nr:hypothetical protein [Spirochaetia bacterium]